MAAFRTVLAVAAVDLLAVLLLMVGALWRSPSAGMVIAAVLSTGVYAFLLAVVLRRAYTRGFLRCFAVLSVLVVLGWALIVTAAMGEASTVSGGLAVLGPVAVVTGAVAHALLKRTLDHARTSE